MSVRDNGPVMDESLKRTLAQDRAYAEKLEGRVAELEAVLGRFKALEFESRSDWQGFCPFRRLLGCHGTDGQTNAAGKPSPKPHEDGCPYAALGKAVGE